MQTNNWNSYYVKNFCLSSFATFCLALCYSSAALAQLNPGKLSQSDRDSIQDKIFTEQARLPDIALVGIFEPFQQVYFSPQQAKQKGKALIGFTKTPSYWYFQADMAPEDEIRDGKGQKIHFDHGPNVIGPIYDTLSLHLVDRMPRQNSSLSSTGVILARKDLADFGDAGACQINPYCLDSLEEMIDASVHILWVNGSLAGFCSGTLVNNTAYDFKPYILSAEHCALNPALVQSTDLNRWVFTFNYHSRDCQNPNSPDAINQDRLVGADLRARSNDNGGDFGSDFLLLELDQAVPERFEAFYAGWNRSSLSPTSGFCLHFPAGDIMKLSTFRNKAEISSFSDQSQDSHWLVNWSQNRGGYGTTEAGSSGSALIDQNGLIVGTLTGGSSACDQPEAPDYYGRFSHQWDQNGTSAEVRLKDWLDPLNSGALALMGIRQGESPPAQNSSTWQLLPNPIEGRNLRLTGIENLREVVEIRWISLHGSIREDLIYPAFFEREIPLSFPFRQSGLYLVSIRQGDKQQFFKVLKP